MDDLKLSREIAGRICEEGGRAFFVGGFVRDQLLGVENKDVDIEVHGIEEEKLVAILKAFGEVLGFGKSFGIYSIKGRHIDIALPRTERATGKGHRDFEVKTDPFLSLTEAARRRDFTINAMMMDVLNGEIIDPFGGQRDLREKVLRHVDDKTFIEDPLRVLRACQFAARFHFPIAEKTIGLCKGIDLSYLPKERVYEELKKALLKSDQPSIFFTSLAQMNQLSFWFKEVEQLIGLKQDPLYHPEGDVFVHTMEVLDRGALYKDKVSDPCCFLLECLVHDLGKITCTFEENGRIHSYGHELEGLKLIETFTGRFCEEKSVMKYLLNLTPLHMLPFSLAAAKSSIKSTNRMFDKAVEPLDLLYLSVCDKGDGAKKEDIDFLFERYEIFKEYMGRDFVKGQDLIDAGLAPDERFSLILDYAHKLRLAGVEKKDALKQCLAYGHRLKKE